jgi:hypothetical protein
VAKATSLKIHILHVRKIQVDKPTFARTLVKLGFYGKDSSRHLSTGPENEGILIGEKELDRQL